MRGLILQGSVRYLRRARLDPPRFSERPLSVAPASSVLRTPAVVTHQHRFPRVAHRPMEDHSCTPEDAGPLLGGCRGHVHTTQGRRGEGARGFLEDGKRGPWSCAALSAGEERTSKAGEDGPPRSRVPPRGCPPVELGCALSPRRPLLASVEIPPALGPTSPLGFEPSVQAVLHRRR